MPSLVWDRVGDRTYETGLDKGVLYLPDGSAVPWNGLTSVVENSDKETSPVYFDGQKINDSVVLGDFAATLNAVTFPDEFEELEGLGSMRKGVFVGDQAPKAFGLCYRTQIGNDLEGDIVGYKIHIIYNVLAIPSDKTYSSQGEDPSLVEFEWNLTGTPEEVLGFRPTCHITINTKDLDPWLLEELEAFLYGSSSAEASLVPMAELVEYISSWYRVKIIDNGDGTWTALSKREGFISISDEDLFTIVHVNARYLNDYTFVISDTLDVSDVPQIRITDNEDGTWSATTDQDNLIFIVDGTFTIVNANILLEGPDYYRITDTTDESGEIMGTVTGYTAEKMQEIIDTTVSGAHITGDDLILELTGGGTVNAGNVRGPTGATGASPIVCTSSTRPGSPFEGLAIWETDTNKYLIYNGVDFTPPWNMPWGFIISNVLSGSYDTSEDIFTSTPALTFTAVANRRYKITFGVTASVGTASGLHQFKLKRDGSTVLNIRTPRDYTTTAEQTRLEFETFALDSPGAGSHTYTVTGVGPSGGPFTLDSGNIMVEDIGPNGVPA